MFRAASASSTLARRTILRASSRGAPSSCFLPGNASFHASAKREDEALKADAVVPAPSKGGLFGTGLSEWFALPLGVAAAVPAIKLEWYVVNEETQLLAVFLAFVVTFYTQGGQIVYDSLDAKAQQILKEHTEAEDKVVQALETKLDFLKANRNMVNDFEAINEVRAAAYDKLNAAGAVKPQHDLKSQIERMLGMIAAEEASVAEKAKVALMSEASAAVTAKFASDKAAKKAALDAAVAKLKGGKGAKADPVAEAFVKFFQDKAAKAKASKDDSEEKAQRAAMIGKMNSVAKNEKFFFEFDAQGTPKMTV
ncbi:hypothetical protein ACHAWF_002875 [Thalassiosira exigua]